MGRKKVVPTFKDVSKEIVLKIVGMCDGWTILPKDELTGAGLSEELASRFVTKHKSGRDPKSQIYVNGSPVKFMMGAYGLSVLYGIAGDLELTKVVNEAYSKMGRGFQAQVLSAGIFEHFKQAA